MVSMPSPMQDSPPIINFDKLLREPSIDDPWGEMKDTPAREKIPTESIEVEIEESENYTEVESEIAEIVSS